MGWRFVFRFSPKGQFEQTDERFWAPVSVYQKPFRMAKWSCTCTTRTCHAEEMRNSPPFHALTLSESKSGRGYTHESWKYKFFLIVYHSSPSAISTPIFPFEKNKFNNHGEPPVSPPIHSFKNTYTFVMAFSYVDRWKQRHIKMRWLRISKTKTNLESTYANRSDDFNSHTWCPEKIYVN